MESQILQILIQGGAVGIALAALYIIYKITNGQRKTFVEALEKNSDAWNKNAEALGALTATLNGKKFKRK